jgi:hypothetical protein
LARINIAFAIPVHPGNAPAVHHAAATGVQIAETIRLFNQEIDDHRLYERVQAELKQQLLKAVDSRYLQVLEDLDFGYADVSPQTMLNHLKPPTARWHPMTLRKIAAYSQPNRMLTNRLKISGYASATARHLEPPSKPSQMVQPSG